MTIDNVVAVSIDTEGCFIICLDGKGKEYKIYIDTSRYVVSIQDIDTILLE